MKRLIALACSAAAILVLAGASHYAQGRRPRTHEIRMRGNSFAPRQVTVTVGDTVVWVNADIVRHNAVRDGSFDSGELRAGERFALVVSDTGEVRYRCTIHSRMRGSFRAKASR